MTTLYKGKEMGEKEIVDGGLAPAGVYKVFVYSVQNSGARIIRTHRADNVHSARHLAGVKFEYGSRMIYKVRVVGPDNLVYFFASRLSGRTKYVKVSN